MSTLTDSDEVIWHDLECGAYTADLRLWSELAEHANGEVLDVGAGTGRVALHLGRASHAVTALDLDPSLLAALRERAGELSVRTVRADARELDLGRSFALIIVPMQTIQLFDGTRNRRAFLRGARSHLRPGGILAVAIAVDLPAFDSARDSDARLDPDVVEIAGRRYESQPLALRHEGLRIVLERERTVIDCDGSRSSERDLVQLDKLDWRKLARDGELAGLRPLARREIAPTDEHVGSEVVVWRA